MALHKTGNKNDKFSFCDLSFLFGQNLLVPYKNWGWCRLRQFENLEGKNPASGRWEGAGRSSGKLSFERNSQSIE